MLLNHLLRKTATLALFASTLPAAVAAAVEPKPAPKTTPAIADFNTCAKPVWPREALRREQQGAVTLSFLISEDGAVTDSHVTKSSGYPLLDDAVRIRSADPRCKITDADLDPGSKPTSAGAEFRLRSHPSVPYRQSPPQ